jgi:hypothetical protein
MKASYETITRGVARVRQSVARHVIRRVLGPVAGQIPRNVIRSLEESAYDESLTPHVVRRDLLCNADTIRFAFPDAFPVCFRREKALDSRSIYFLEDVLAGPDTGVVWLSDGRVLQESVGSLGRITGWGRVTPELLRKPRAHEDSAVLVPCPDTGYYHWLLEVLPNVLHVMNTMPEAKILLPQKCGSYVLEGLVLALGEEIRRRIVRSSTPLAVRNLAFATYEPYSGFVRGCDIEVIRNGLLTTSTVSSRRRSIYISRRFATKRKLANEAELEDALMQAGVEVVYCEELSLQEQIGLFASVNVIIAPHGAGLANLAWCGPKVKVLEIMPATMFNDCFARLALTIGLEYDFVRCIPIEGAAGRIPIEAVTKWISEAGLE